MTYDNHHNLITALILALSTVLSASSADAQTKSPAVGDIAPDFRLPTLQGEGVQLSKLRGKGPVVLVVLRGFPGYQCPICNTQVGQLLAQAAKLSDKNAKVVLVYPGPAERLTEHAAEFVRGKSLPENFYLVVDADYALTEAYRLRWNASRETAYPSTFVIDNEGKVRFAKISKGHGGRATADEVLAAL